jgi:hypothetical protein
MRDLALKRYGKVDETVIHTDKTQAACERSQL